MIWTNGIRTTLRYVCWCRGTGKKLPSPKIHTYFFKKSSVTKTNITASVSPKKQTKKSQLLKPTVLSYLGRAPLPYRSVHSDLLVMRIRQGAPAKTATQFLPSYNHKPVPDIFVYAKLIRSQFLMVTGFDTNPRQIMNLNTKKKRRE